MTIEGNLVFLLKMKHLVKLFVCMTNFRSYICIFTSRNNLFQRCLILREKLVHLEFLLTIATENVFSFAYFLTQLNAKPSLQN